MDEQAPMTVYGPSGDDEVGGVDADEVVGAEVVEGDDRAVAGEDEAEDVRDIGQDVGDVAFADDLEGRSADGPSSMTNDYEPTGRPDVDRVLERLGELDGTRPADHVDVYEDAHRRLHETLLAAGEGREDHSVS